MNIWYAIPTIRPKRCGATFERWQQRGYRTAAAVDVGADFPDNADMVIEVEYAGYGHAINRLCRAIPEADIVVIGGDDVYPDQLYTAQELGARFVARFPDLFGIAQPTGDGFGLHDLVCQSPWIGREWIAKAYGGRGPLHGGYWHYYVDQELHDVAHRTGVLAKWPDVSQYHDHWQRTKSHRPADLQRARDRWASDKRMYETRKEEGFPGWH
jgi:hypothetical protein